MNEIESFFFYMWNWFDQYECSVAFAESTCAHEYLWERWCEMCEKYNGPSGAIAPFYGYLDRTNRELLVKRALKCYDGPRRINS